MTLTIKVKGLDATLKALKSSVNKKIDAGMKQVSNLLIEDLKDNTPVDTGEARAGWFLSEKSRSNVIENDVEHISNLNEGTSSQAPSNFIESTLLSRRDVKPDGVIVRYK